MTGRKERSLRGFSVEEAQQLTGVAGMRAQHITSENARVQQAVEAMRRGDVAQFGKLMTESHQSLRRLYEVSSPELDFLVDEANRVEGVLGARLTGAGFGGCTITLMRPSALPAFQEMLKRYATTFGLDADWFVLDKPYRGGRLVF